MNTSRIDRKCNINQLLCIIYIGVGADGGDCPQPCAVRLPLGLVLVLAPLKGTVIVGAPHPCAQYWEHARSSRRAATTLSAAVLLPPRCRHRRHRCADAALPPPRLSCLCASRCAADSALLIFCLCAADSITAMVLIVRRWLMVLSTVTRF
jgi:hypothetical protein